MTSSAPAIRIIVSTRGIRRPFSMLPISVRCSRQRLSRIEGWFFGAGPRGASNVAGAVYSRFSRANVGGPEALRKGWNRPLSDLVLPQALPQGVFWPILRSPKNTKTRLISGFPSYSGGRIRTCDLRVMSPTSYLAAPPRGVERILATGG